MIRAARRASSPRPRALCEHERQPRRRRGLRHGQPMSLTQHRRSSGMCNACARSSRAHPPPTPVAPWSPSTRSGACRHRVVLARAGRHARLHARAARVGPAGRRARSRRQQAPVWRVRGHADAAGPQRRGRHAWPGPDPWQCASSSIWPGASSPMAAASKCRKWAGTRCTASTMPAHPLWQGIDDGSWYYFVHSFYAQVPQPAHCAAQTDYGGRFAAPLHATIFLPPSFTPKKRGPRPGLVPQFPPLEALRSFHCRPLHPLRPFLIRKPSCCSFLPSTSKTATAFASSRAIWTKPPPLAKTRPPWPARWLEKGARRLHLVDLNGAFAGKPQELGGHQVHPQRAVGDDIPVQLGGGIRDLDTIEKYIDAACATSSSAPPPSRTPAF